MFTRTMESLSGMLPQVKEFLSGIQYPVNKQSLVEFARSKGASGTIMSLLERLPDKQYHSEQEVSDELSSSSAASGSGSMQAESSAQSQSQSGSQGSMSGQSSSQSSGTTSGSQSSSDREPAMSGPSSGGSRKS